MINILKIRHVAEILDIDLGDFGMGMELLKDVFDEHIDDPSKEQTKFGQENPAEYEREFKDWLAKEIDSENIVYVPVGKGRYLVRAQGDVRTLINELNFKSEVFLGVWDVRRK